MNEEKQAQEQPPDEQGRARVRFAVRVQLQEQGSWPLRDQAGQVRSYVWEQIRERVQEQVWDQVWDQVRGSMPKREIGGTG